MSSRGFNSNKKAIGTADKKSKQKQYLLIKESARGESNVLSSKHQEKENYENKDFVRAPRPRSPVNRGA